jgi:quinol-cytochrome oxidoreductase complex cytochrome b subunit
MGHPDNYIEANPLVTPAHIVPEWYFLPYYAILRAIPSKLGGVIFMFASIAILAFLPWLDTSRIRSAVYRPLFKLLFWAFILCVIGLGYLGSQPVSDGAVLAARVLTAFYFIYFLVLLPALGLFETPLEPPASIADAVLAKQAEPARTKG